MAVVRGIWNNVTSNILACVQIWYDFRHLQCINQCCWPPLVFLQWIAIAVWLFAFSVSFLSFMFYALCSKTPGLHSMSIVSLPFLTILKTTTWPSMLKTHTALWCILPNYKLLSPYKVRQWLWMRLSLWILKFENLFIRYLWRIHRPK